jgi:nudix-type nucleoside diphosphatase (YffH/AdpP family)
VSARVDILAVEPLSHRWARLDLYRIAYRRRDGQTEILAREVHDHGHGACVLPHDPGRGTVLLVRQFRLPAHVAGAEGHMIEVCAGLLEGNDPATCARREAEEELGYRLRNLRQVGSVFTTPGAVTERVTMFLADYDQADRHGSGGGNAQEGEDIEVLELPLATVLEMIRLGTIMDAKTVLMALLLERDLGSR